MNETLSVIDEHMNDMSTPPASLMNSKRNSSGIGYSYITGQETDDEENPLHTEDEVMSWSPDRVAEYLEDNGVETSHCDIFKEQEISGEVLLAMEQSSLFLKEFALGSVGRRLKTWHKIRALQHEVRQGKKVESQKNSFEIPEEDEEDAVGGDSGRNRASTVGAVPRALDTSRQSTIATASNDTSSSTAAAVSPLQNMTSAVRPEDEWKASAQAMREKQISVRQSRRLSGVNADTNVGSLDAAAREGHRKQPSIDESWRLGQPQTNGGATSHSHTMSADALPRLPKRESSLHSPSIPSTPYEEVDREYYSSNETENRTATMKKPQQKKAPTSVASTSVSRASSNRRSTLSGGFISADVFRDSFSPNITQGIFGALNSVGSSIRSATSPQVKRKPTAPLRDGGNPIVTKLDYSASSDALTSSPNPMTTLDGPTTQRSTTSPKLPFFSSQKPKISGMRTTSDAVTRNERLSASPIKDGNASSPARTGSTTPSTETQSLEYQKTEAQLRMSLAPGVTLAPPNQHRMKVKPKKATSAYTRGLERKTPAEQILGSDYSGWMKKKSGSLMATWKPRLFILKGRRLSYYYSDMDTEEKGLIDISFHRVLPAHNETLTGIHAAVTGAAGSPSSPKDSVTQTHAQQDLESKPVFNESNDGMFIFKLVPPKTGLSKGVNFTKPTVHYFAVNSRQEGRLWMAALMKATIDKDEDGMVTTTYNQKTISLAKARARRERPPALKDSDMEDRAELDGEDDSSGRGLGIGGLGENSDTLGGAEQAQDDTSSMAPSTVATGLESFVEKEAVSAA